MFDKHGHLIDWSAEVDEGHPIDKLCEVAWPQETVSIDEALEAVGAVAGPE